MSNSKPDGKLIDDQPGTKSILSMLGIEFKPISIKKTFTYEKNYYNCHFVF